MPLPQNWATPEDFATLFQYFWHRDFPISKTAIAAKRTDWTIHIGVVVRQIGDLMGLVTRFEGGGRKDAVLRAMEGDEIAVEWEWSEKFGNELEKLRDPKKIWKKNIEEKKLLRFAVLVTYTEEEIESKYKEVEHRWAGADWPLLLILIVFDRTSEFHSGRKFKRINMSVFDSNRPRNNLRDALALPWDVVCSRWAEQKV